MLFVMYSFMNKEKFDAGDDMPFANSTKDFTKQLVEAWGEHHITHYMVYNNFLYIYVIFVIVHIYF